MTAAARTIAGTTIELVGTDERVDLAWEDANADQIRTDWEYSARRRARERERERRLKTLGRRLDEAVHTLQAMSTAPAGSIVRQGGRSCDTDHAPRPMGDPTEVIAHELQIIEKLVERAEQKVDHHRGLGGDVVRDRDTEVWEDWQGVRSEQVAEAAPHLGTSARTIERAREREADRRKVRVRLVDGVILRPLNETERGILEDQGSGGVL